MGLSTALSIRELKPKASIVVFEGGILPRGASTKNAGFACFGSLTELLTDIENMGEEAACQLVLDRWQGLQMLRKRIGDQALGYENCGGYELLFESDAKCLDQLDRVNEILKSIFKQSVFSENRQFIERFGINPKRVSTVLANPFEGQLNAGTMMKSLIRLAAEQGIDYLTGAMVKSSEQTNHGFLLNVSSVNPETIKFSAEKVGVCTNAFTRQLFPDLDLNPGRGMVLITKPLKNLKIKGVFHYHQGYYYFRNVGSRVLFGGGRNIDIDGERTTDFGINQQIYQHLVNELSNLILPAVDFEVDHFWSGIMAFGPDKRPLIDRHITGIGYAVGLGGMGVALGSLAGDRLAKILCLPENS